MTSFAVNLNLRSNTCWKCKMGSAQKHCIVRTSATLTLLGRKWSKNQQRVRTKAHCGKTRGQYKGAGIWGGRFHPDCGTVREFVCEKIGRQEVDFGEWNLQNCYSNQMGQSGENLFADSLWSKKKARVNRAISWNHQDCTRWWFYDKDTPFINTAKIQFFNIQILFDNFFWKIRKYLQMFCGFHAIRTHRHFKVVPSCPSCHPKLYLCRMNKRESVILLWPTLQP